MSPIADTPLQEPALVLEAAAQERNSTALSGMMKVSWTSETPAAGKSLPALQLVASWTDTIAAREGRVPHQEEGQGALTITQSSGTEETLLERIAKTRAGLLGKLYAQQSLSREEEARLAIVDGQLDELSPRIMDSEINELNRIRDDIIASKKELDSDWDALNL